MSVETYRGKVGKSCFEELLLGFGTKSQVVTVLECPRHGRSGKVAQNCGCLRHIFVFNSANCASMARLKLTKGIHSSTAARRGQCYLRTSSATMLQPRIPSREASLISLATALNNLALCSRHAPKSRQPQLIFARHASHAAQGRANGPKDSAGRRLGAKKSQSEWVIPGNIIFKQRGNNLHVMACFLYTNLFEQERSGFLARTSA